MRINTNTAAMNTYSQLTSANASKSSSLAKLSSGLRINKAGDDAAGLAISEKMKNQISGMTQASRNAQDGISLIQTAEGALSETHSILNRMRDLTVQASNDTNTTADREAIQKEIDSLTKEVGRIAGDTQFNTKTLLTEGTETDGSTKFSFQIGANAGQKIDLSIKDMSSVGLKIATAEGTSLINVSSNTDTLVDDPALVEGGTTPPVEGGTTPPVEEETTPPVEEGIDTLAEASETNNTGKISTFDASLKIIDNAIKSVSEERANLGAVQNRLDHTVSNLATTKENLSEANSRITDVDMAEEMMSFTKSNILSQASTAMLAQANQMPQGVLQLLQ
ncbi:flagellin N-terminal helical domain-containing protein [Carnobacterium sp. FSL W8-0810]|uniref:flagellin N-terminal helical domain-containing protein n=1 Tax=Carnobacterium sp. FSL W8-0810 TaxID=2954705 RepID=UPI0030FA48F2